MNVGHGKEPEEESGGGARVSQLRDMQMHGLVVKNSTDQFVMEEWILKVKVFSGPALEDASKNCPIICSIGVN